MNTTKQVNLLNKFKKDFQSKTTVEVTGAYVGIGNWFNLEFDGVDCEQLGEISEFIKNKFSQKGNFRHKLPTVRGNSSGYGTLVLVVDQNIFKRSLQIKKHSPNSRV